MYASHASLRDDFEVSCAELDFVVEVKDDDTQYGNIKWHLGSRITRIIKHACVNDSIRNFLTITWNNCLESMTRRLWPNDRLLSVFALRCTPC